MEPPAATTTQDLDEPRPIYSGAPSWKVNASRYAFGVALGLAGIAGVAGGLALGVGVWMAAVGGLCAAVATWLVAEGELRRRATHYRISTRSIDVEQGILSKRIDTLQLWRVRDVVFEQNLGERLLGYSRILVITMDDTSPKVVLRGVTDGRALFDRLKIAVESARKRGNVMGIVE